jgi:hypothetical protein
MFNALLVTCVQHVVHVPTWLLPVLCFATLC